MSIAEEFPQLLTLMRLCQYLRADWICMASILSKHLDFIV